ncbi:hypothetical protein PUN28_018829 [Cardiocondyla obscurior]|uniref:Uncharacterized protein n=1 Tax=Cardiocondyla obscurior TaxID=286306 RepID=A0AAW2EG38_9HYME
MATLECKKSRRDGRQNGDSRKNSTKSYVIIFQRRGNVGRVLRPPPAYVNEHREVSCNGSGSIYKSLFICLILLTRTLNGLHFVVDTGRLEVFKRPVIASILFSFFSFFFCSLPTNEKPERFYYDYLRWKHRFASGHPTRRKSASRGLMSVKGNGINCDLNITGA